MFRRIALFSQRVANATPLFSLVERALLPAARGGPLAPILILGCPRSGTTLLYEFITTTFRTAYPSNAASLLYRAPVLATRLAQAIVPAHTARFKSDLGYVGGLLAPSEAGALIRYWLTGPDPLVRTDPALLIRQVAGLVQLMGGPLVLKNLHLEEASDQLLATFPQCRIIRMRRDWRFTAQSILAARRREFGSETVWLGPKPPGYEKLLGETPERQVAWQITQIERWIDNLSEKLDVGSPMLECEYKELCARPRAFAEQLRGSGVFGPTADLEFQALPPERFELSERVELSPERWSILGAALAEAGLPPPKDA